MKHNSYGFTNWARFRNRGMYVLDPKATYSLEPKYESKKVKKNKKKEYPKICEVESSLQI